MDRISGCFRSAGKFISFLLFQIHDRGTVRVACLTGSIHDCTLRPAPHAQQVVCSSNFVGGTVAIGRFSHKLYHKNPTTMRDQKQRFAGSEATLPHFAYSRTALSQEERATISKRKGLCVQCRQKTYVASVFKKAPITNDNVYKGVCIKCRPSEVPAKVLLQ